MTDTTILTDQQLDEYEALIARTTPLGAVTASPGILTVLVAEVRRLRAVVPAVVEPPADRDNTPTDRRRRIYLDGDGNAWLSLSHDRGIQYIGRLAGAFDGDDTTISVRERTGSLREIGRCW